MRWKRVIEILDGDTFRVERPWRWKGRTGDLIRPTGYNTPEKGQRGYIETTEKLRRVLFGRTVKLTNAVCIDRGRLVCKVYVGNINLTNFFPEYQR